MQSWGFNTVTIQAHVDDYPTTIDSFFPLDSMGLHTNPVKMPFIASIRAAYYAMRNPAIGAAPLLTNPVKDMIFSHSSFDTNFVPSGIADYYDSGIGTWLTADLASSSDFWAAMATSPYLNYMIGMGSDDGDQMNGFGAGPDFATNLPGHNNANLALRVAAMSPLQTAASNVANGVSYVYADTLIHTKKALRDSLATEYGTVAALNAAWGSGYTTFDSSGTCVGSQPITCASTESADSVGTGNGSTLTFSTTLSHTTISAFSLQILVAGTPVAGDLGPGGGTTSTFYGPNVSTSSINYSTGAISITFTAGHAPANGAAITATYVANGWGIGTGFLDEDNRTAHNSYLGTDWIALSNAGATVQTDLTAFLKSMAAQYFSTCRTQLKAVFPNNMYLGPDALDSWNAPSAAPVLQAAGQYIDLFITSDSQVFTQAMLDFIATNYGDKPFLGGFYSVANPDSAMAAFGDSQVPGVYTTQPNRGQGYYNMMQAQLQTAHTTAGNFPYVGVTWFTYIDIPGEQLNWGLTTPSDNAYNAHEAAVGSVACSAPISTYTCGSEPTPGGNAVRPFGDLIGGTNGVAAANALWLSVK